MNTIEGNKLIAEFMGMKEYATDVWSCAKTDRVITLGEYRPHEDWNELMPVVEKMSTIHYGWDNMETPYDDCCYPRTFGMLNAEGKPMVRFNSSQVFTADTLIEATWLSVVDFIQWYNNQTNTNKNNKS